MVASSSKLQASSRTRARIAVVLLALLAACGKKETAAVDEAYNAFKYRNFILGQTMSGGATLEGSIDIDGSRDGGAEGDWIELAINGNTLLRLAGAASNRVSMPIRLRPGPNWVRFFSSKSRLGWEFEVDARIGTRLEFTPKDAQGFDMVQRKDE